MHRRKYLPQNKMGHYELLRLRSHARKWSAMVEAAEARQRIEVRRQVRMAAWYRRLWLWLRLALSDWRGWKYVWGKA